MPQPHHPAPPPPRAGHATGQRAHLRPPPRTRGRRPGAPPVALRAHGRLPARIRGRPADLAGRHPGRLRAHVDGHHEGPQALGDVDRSRRRLRPPSVGRGRLPALVPGRHPAGLHRRRADPPALDGHRRDGRAHPADRVSERAPLVPGRGPHRLQHARAACAPEARRTDQTPRGRRVGAAGHHGGPLQEPPGRGRLPRLRLQPHLRPSGRRGHPAPGHVGRLPALRPGRVDPRRHPPRLLVEPQRRLGTRPPELRAVHRVGPDRRDPRAHRPARTGSQPGGLPGRRAGRLRRLRGPHPHLPGQPSSSHQPGRNRPPCRHRRPRP